MRLLIVVQRYGLEVFGGAEQLARKVGEQFARRGDTVEVVTSRALSYTDWADWYPDGDAIINGVRVHRLSVARPRNNTLFNGINSRTAIHGWQVSPFVEEEWMRLQGPEIRQLNEWLGDRSREFDLTLFFTYLYYTSWSGLRATGSPAVLQPTAHDEPPAMLTLFDEMFRFADGYAFISPEEAEFVVQRYRVRRPNRVVGIGFETHAVSTADPFRERFGLGSDPYLICVGRTEPGKGSVQLFEFFRTFKRRHPCNLKLVFLGEEVYPLPRDDDVVMTGFVDEGVMASALAGAMALVQPSFFESFSMVLAEGWAAGLPAMVQRRCAVLAGQAQRSRAALPYETYGEFETAQAMLLESASLRAQLGQRGREYVSREFRWDRVLSRYDDLFDEILTGHPRPARVGSQS